MRIQHEAFNEFFFECEENVRHNTMKYLQTHNCYEIYYLVRGNRKYFLDNEVIGIEPGDLVVVPPDTLHQSIEDGEKRYTRALLYVPRDLFEKDLLEKFAPSSSAFILKIPKHRRPFFESLLDKLEYEFIHHDEYRDYLIRKYVNELLIFLLRMTKGEFFSHAILESARTVNVATEFISKNFEKNLSLETVARYVGMSKSHFCRIFKEQTGFNFSDYLTGVRIVEATKLLNNTELSITEIAAKCGYNDSAYFASIFKRVKGMTPMKYRRSPEM